MLGWTNSPVDVPQLSNALVQLDVCDHPTRQNDITDAGLLQVVGHVVGCDALEHMLIARSHVDLRELGRQHACEIEVVALADPERSRLQIESRQQHVAENLRIAIRCQSDDLPFVTARLESQRRRHRFVERPQRVWILDAMQRAESGRPRPTLIVPARPEP